PQDDQPEARVRKFRAKKPVTKKKSVANDDDEDVHKFSSSLRVYLSDSDHSVNKGSDLDFSDEDDNGISNLNRVKTHRRNRSATTQLTKMRARDFSSPADIDSPTERR